MRVEYSPRAQADLIEIADYSRAQFGRGAASRLETYIRATIARIAVMPESGERVPERNEVRVVSLVRYPFRIFYAASADTDTVTILHVRHTSRRPWNNE